MSEMFDKAAAVNALLSKPRIVTRCESCKGPLNPQTGECNCSS
jgi:hypothetical protein